MNKPASVEQITPDNTEMEPRTSTQRQLRIAVVRFVLLLGVNSLSLALTFALLPGLSVTGPGWVERAAVLMIAALAINLINFGLRPVLRLLAIPLGALILFGASFFINAGLLEAIASLLPGLEVDGWVSAFLGSVLMSVANFALIQLATDERLGPLVSPRRLPKLVLPGGEAGRIPPEKNSFSPRTLRVGLALVDVWPRLALQAFLLNRQAYAAIAEDVRMSGPALLITLVVAIVGSLTRVEGLAIVFILRWLLVWLMAITFFYAALRILRSKTTVASLARVLGFAQTTYLLESLAAIPALAPFAIGAATFLNFAASLVGASAASKLTGRRAWVIPVLALAFVLMRVYFLQRLLDGLFITLLGLLARLGMIPLP